MKLPVLMLTCTLLMLTACSLNKPHEEKVATEASTAGLQEVKSNSLDAVYLDKASINKYQEVFLEPLDMSNLKIRKPGSTLSYDTPWELDDRDRKFYQERYQISMKKEWLAKSNLRQVDQPGASTLRVKALLLEIAPLGSKDDSKGRPTMTKVYSEGMGTMTLKYELSDAATGKVLGLISDQRELGNIWQENNRATFNQKVRLVFDAWARRLQKELN